LREIYANVSSKRERERERETDRFIYSYIHIYIYIYIETNIRTSIISTASPTTNTSAHKIIPNNMRVSPNGDRIDIR
jgi:hypothetical protein